MHPFHKKSGALLPLCLLFAFFATTSTTPTKLSASRLIQAEVDPVVNRSFSANTPAQTAPLSEKHRESPS